MHFLTYNIVPDRVIPRLTGCQWIELKRGEHIQGALAQIYFTRRIYVVTVPPPGRYAGAKPCWPRIAAGRA